MFRSMHLSELFSLQSGWQRFFETTGELKKRRKKKKEKKKKKKED